MFKKNLLVLLALFALPFQVLADNSAFSTGGGASGNVTTSANIADNVVVRGDGGGTGIQGSGLTITDSNVLQPNTSDAGTLGAFDHMWSDAFWASGAVHNWNNGDATLTHSADLLTLGGAQLTVARPGQGLSVQNSTDAVSNQIARFGGGDRATPTVGDEGYISLYLDNALGNQVEYARLTSASTVVTTGGHAGELKIGVAWNGSIEQRTGFGVDYFAPVTGFSSQYDLGAPNRYIRTMFVGTAGGISCNNGNSTLAFADNLVTVGGADLSAPNYIVGNGGAIQSNPVASHSMSFQVYDNDATSYVTWAAILNANNPVVDLKEAYVTMNGGYIYRGGGTDVARIDGGTGQSFADPGFHALYLFDTTTNTTVQAAIGAGLTYDSGTSTLSASQALASGTYTPTRSSETNLDANATMSEAQYMRVGATVTVSGRFVIDPTATLTPTSFQFTIPVSSNFSNAEDAAGTAVCGGVSGQSIELIADGATNNFIAQWVSIDTTSQPCSFTATYQVI